MFQPEGKAPRPAEERTGALDSNRLGLVVLGAAMVASATLLLWLERGITFMVDEWSWVNRAATGSPVELLHPINQHLLLVPLLTAKGLLAAWGMSLVPFELAQIAGILACSGVVYAFSRRRVGPILALAPAMVPLFLGSSYSVLMQTLLGVQGIYVLVFGIGALLAIERNTRGGDVAACALLTLALASFSSGLAFVAGVAVAVLLSDDRLRRSYVWVVPLLLYVAYRLWALQFGSGGGPQLANVPALPFYFVDSIAASATALFGREALVGKGPGASLFVSGFDLDQAMAALFFAALEVGAIVFAARRLVRRGPIPVTLWSTLAVPIALWLTQGLVLDSVRMPGENRYLYAGAVVLTLAAVELARNVRLSRLGVAAVLGLTALAIAGNAPRLEEGRAGIAYHAIRARAYTGVMDLDGRHAPDPSYIPADDLDLGAGAGALWITVGGYLELSERYGPFGDSPRQIMEEDEEIRHGADLVAVSMLGLRLTPAAALPDRGCFRAAPAAAGELVVLPRGGAVLHASGETPVELRRFAGREAVPLGELAANRPARLAVPADRARPWELWARRPVALTVCPLSG